MLFLKQRDDYLDSLYVIFEGAITSLGFIIKEILNLVIGTKIHCDGSDSESVNENNNTQSTSYNESSYSDENNPLFGKAEIDPNLADASPRTLRDTFQRHSLNEEAPIRLRVSSTNPIIYELTQDGKTELENNYHIDFTGPDNNQYSVTFDDDHNEGNNRRIFVHKVEDNDDLYDEYGQLLQDPFSEQENQGNQANQGGTP